MSDDELTELEWRARAEQALAIVQAQMAEIEAWQGLVDRLSEVIGEEVRAAPMVTLAAARLDEARQHTAELIDGMSE